MSWLTRFTRHRTPQPLALSVRAVTFDTTGWFLVHSQVTPQYAEWRSREGDTLSVRMDAGSLEGWRPLMDLDSMRALFRDIAVKRGGAIVSVDVAQAGQLCAVKVLSKCRHGMGYAYEGALLIPLRDARCTVAVQAEETGTTGVREAVVSACVAERGEMEIEARDAEAADEVRGQRVKGWHEDPYDARWNDGALYGMSDDKRLDELYPWHALSRTRRKLTDVARTLSVDRALLPDLIVLPSLLDEHQAGPRRLLPPGVAGELSLRAGRFDLAERLLSEELPEGELVTGRSVVRNLRLLACAQHAQGKGEDAGRSLGRAYEAVSAVFAEGPSSRALALSELAHASCILGRLSEAETAAKEALEVLEAEGQPAAPAGVALNELGLVRTAQGRHAEAMAFFERALSLFEEVRGPQFPDCAAVLSNMAVALEGLGEKRRASEARKRAARIRRSPTRSRPEG